MVYKRIGFRRDWYTKGIGLRVDYHAKGQVLDELSTKGLVLDESDIQKDRFQTRVGYKRIGFRREWYTKG